MLLQRSFHSPHGLITGDAPYVGVLDLPSRGTHRPPIRLFFPASVPDSETPKKANYFVGNRIRYVLEGLSHIGFARHHTKLFRFVVRPFIWMLSLFLPPRYLKIPETAVVTKNSSVQYLPPSALKLNKTANTKQRLVIFSHGLTGTGEENSIFCTALAKKGYVVASLHHRDGSSSRVPMPDGSCKFYEHFPSGEDYDPQNRLDQVKARSSEMLDACDWLLNMGSTEMDETEHELQQYHTLKEIYNNLDERNIIVSGFSYGAATSALAATMRPKQFQCAVLLDGWFQIGVTSKNLDIDFPPDAFTTETNKGFDIPSLFINSAAFERWAKGYDATSRLAKQISDNGSEMHVIPDTMHQNFIDLTFWMPKWILKKFTKYFGMGNADPYKVHESIMNWTLDFIDKNFRDH
jgi:platelet-activating factor acetylhydrolase